jgi:hypothetical protein
LGVLTAFFDTSDPVQTSAPTDPQTGLSDPTLTFGAMEMMHGRALSIGGADQSQSPMSGTPTYKSWFQLPGRSGHFLMEEVPYQRVAAQLEQLPPATGRLNTVSTNLLAANSFLDAIPARLLSPPASGEPVKTQTMRLSRVDGDQRPGVVLDYVLMNADKNNFTLQGDTTYLVSGWVNLNGATTIEGGTVVKYDNTVNSIICFEGTVACKTGPYRPAIFTSRNDTSVGEDVNNGGSLALYQAIAGTAVGNSTWHNLIVRYAQTGIHYYSINLTDCQFVNCQDALYTEWGPANLTNVLFVNVNTPFAGTTYNATGYHLTIDGCTNGQVSSDWAGRGLSTVHLVNSLLVNAGADGDAAITTNYTVRLVTNPASIFQTVGAGNCYLKTNSPYHQQGTANIAPAILSDLATKTTYPPIVYSNITISAATTFSPQARRDTNSSPDLGYHYDPLDYVFGGVNVYSNLTFTAGTAVGCFELPNSYGNGYGISIFDHVVLALNGTASQPCTVARYSTVQEGGTGLWRDKSWPSAIVGQSLSGGYGMNPANAAQVWLNFTRHSALAGDPPHYRELTALLKVAAQNSEFWGSGVGAYWEYLNFTNCLFDRSSFGNLGGNPAICGVRNCTMHGGSVTLSKYGLTWPVWIEECAFDGTTFSVDDNSNGNTNITYCDFNAFLTNGNRLPMRGAHDVTNLLSFNWQSGWLGNYYLPATSPLIDHGSTTADHVGLYHFTTQTNQVPETNSIVDIGYHYVAVDNNGNPLETFTNNAPDYLVDANGDGLPDWWEMYWFGNLSHSGSDLDASGYTLLYDYQNGINPTVFNKARLDHWAFDNTNVWQTENGQSPLVATNVAIVPSWSFLATNAALVNNPNTALLCYPNKSAVGNANIAFRSGTLRFMFQPNWSSVDAGGTGPGDSARLIETGAYSPNFTTDWWALYFSPDGNQMIFAGSSGGVACTNLVASISFVSNLWYQVVLTYTLTSSALYVDCQLVTNGTGTGYYLKNTDLSGNFRIGTDANGNNQALGAFDELETFNYALSAGEVNYSDGNITAVVNAAGGGVPVQQCTVTYSASFSRPAFSSASIHVPEPGIVNEAYNIEGLILQSPGTAILTKHDTCHGDTIVETLPFYFNSLAGSYQLYNELPSESEYSYGAFSSQLSRSCNIEVPFTPSQSGPEKIYVSGIATATVPLNQGYCSGPLPAGKVPFDVYPKERLAYWSFDNGLLCGDGGQLPVTENNNSISFVPSPFGAAVEFDTPQAGKIVELKYPMFQKDIFYGYDMNGFNLASTGTPNVRRNEGTVRFWFKPNWSSGSGPSSGVFMDMVGNYWTLKITASGNTIELDSNGSTLCSGNINWTAGKWHQIAVTYSQTQTVLYVDGNQVGTTGTGLTPLFSYDYPNSYTVIGGEGTSQQVWGAMDELETFNYQLTTIHSDYTAACLIDSDGDGIPNVTEANNGTNPNDPDNGVPVPPYNPGDTTLPFVNLIQPVNAIPQ